ncbi:FAD:protein FMN transferase [Psychrobacter sp. M13]|uniref:FAD:protein FMN transferase n=1 Tax=Psychrobacter sp. M13 TaxID=3067275 RepID=UPI00273BF41C|nr:FAD:protein FMN transferase [Psychrobacter sp. M13]WLP95459.1 FAD:protein FMN transferase [Psychrobacter sp. M13]
MINNVSHENAPQLATIKLYAMGCHIQISLNTARLNTERLSTPYSQASIDQQVALLADDIQQQLVYWEHIFSRFDDTSELMTLNSNTGQWTNVSAELFAMLQRAIYFVPKTQGLVTPTLLKSMWVAGYKQSFEALPKHAISSLPISTTNTASTAITGASLQDTSVTNDAQLNHANQHAERIRMRLLDNGQQQICLPTGMALDLNGYVKGWCAMQLAEQISQLHNWHFPCLVDMGGDIAIGVPSDQDIDKPIVWGVAVAKPHLMNGEPIQDQEDVAILAIKSGGVATSGQDYRRWWHKGQWQHHLIHPHYSRPVSSDVLTATVLADDTLMAEVYAKYCVLLGVNEAMAWLNKNHIAALLIATDNQVLTSHAISSNLVHSESIAI